MARRKNVKRIDPRYFLNEQGDTEYGAYTSGKHKMQSTYGIVDLRQAYDALPDGVKQRYEAYVQQPENEKVIGDLTTPEMVFKWELRTFLFGRDGARHSDDPMSETGRMMGISGAQGQEIVDKDTLIKVVNRAMARKGVEFDVAPFVSDASEAPGAKFQDPDDQKYQVSSASPLKETTDILNNFKNFLTEG